jgi:oleandomycin transport system ATP-binding protein
VHEHHGREAQWAIRAEGLVKRFGTRLALRGVDLRVPAGTVLGVLGRNGAGKTTVVRILSTLLRPDGGRAEVAGHDVVADPVCVQRSIGLTGQYASVDDDLSGLDNLLLFGRLLGLSRTGARARAEELMDRFGLADAASYLVKAYSGGMRRRLDLAASLVSRPPVLFLDEPTTGLDPHVRSEMWQMIRGLVAEGTSVLLTTQYLDEADQLADRITVLDRGRVVAEGHPEELKRLLGGQTIQVRPSSRDDLDIVSRILAELTGTTPSEDSEIGILTASVSDPVLLSVLVRQLDAAGVTADELALRLPSLDEVFLALTSSSGVGAPVEESLP